MSAVLILVMGFAGEAGAWWDKEWSGRKAFTIDTSKEGGAIEEKIGGTTVLLRLHEGNFPFDLVKPDGSDIRFVAGDDKTALPFHIERFDGLMREAFIWVRVEDVAPSAKTQIWMYYGGGGAAGPDYKQTFGKDARLIYHFAEKGAVPADSSPTGASGENAGTPSEGSIIGTGVRFVGSNPIKVPANEKLNAATGSDASYTAWLKPATGDGTGIVLERGDGALRIGLENGVPYVEIAGGTKITGKEPLLSGQWSHTAIVFEAGKAALYVNGEVSAGGAANVPAIVGGLIIGSGSAEGSGFLGELDELEYYGSALTAGAVKLAAVGQNGADRALRLVVPGEQEGAGGTAEHSAVLEHVSLFGDIAGNMMFDGWIAVALCVVMMIAGWTVAFTKNSWLSKIKKGNEEFLRQWKKVATDLTAMDGEDPRANKLANQSPAVQRLMHNSPLYHLYQTGVEEIQYRLGDNRSQGLSARSMQAIRAALDASMVHEEHKLGSKLVYLTFSIAGGPYVGLMGTVVGVMITFAVISKTGEVEVASIAPGIASALLATVFGLLVAIPSLFLYSDLSSKIKVVTATMKVFIDEFIAKMAEYYPTPGEPGVHGRRKIDMGAKEPEGVEA